MATRNKSLKKICPLEAALDMIGGKWKGMIIFNLFDRKMRFNELLNTMPSITNRILIRQLRQLESDGIIIRKKYITGRLKVFYQLTRLGCLLKSILLELKKWGCKALEK